MQKYLSVTTHRAGTVHINRQTGHLLWEEENLDPVVKQYAKKYLVQEGFLEQALGVLDPAPHEVPDLLLDDISKQRPRRAQLRIPTSMKPTGYMFDVTTPKRVLVHWRPRPPF